MPTTDSDLEPGDTGPETDEENMNFLVNKTDNNTKL